MVHFKFLNKNNREDRLCKIFNLVAVALIQNELKKTYLGKHTSEIQEQIFAECMGWTNAA